MDGGGSTKAALLAAIAREGDAWDALIGEVGDARMLDPGPMGDWTFKDVAAHLTAWRRRSLDRLEAAARGRPEPPPPWPAGLESDDEINAWFHAADRDRPLADVLQASRQSYDRLAEAVRALPDDAVADPRRFPWLEGESLAAAVTSGSFFAHLHDEHEPAIRAWLATTAGGRAAR